MASTSGVVRDTDFKKGVLTSVFFFFFKQTTTTKSCLKHTKANESWKKKKKKETHTKLNAILKCYKTSMQMKTTGAVS